MLTNLKVASVYLLTLEYLMRESISLPYRIRQRINFSPLSDKAVGISITSRNNKNTTRNEWNLVSLYNPPNTQLNPSFLNFINQLKGNVLLMGDLSP